MVNEWRASAAASASTTSGLPLLAELIGFDMDNKDRQLKKRLDPFNFPQRLIRMDNKGQVIKKET